MHVILSVQTDAILPPQIQHAFDAYFRREKSRAELAAELCFDTSLLNHLLAELFDLALTRNDDTAHIEVRP